MTAIPKSELNKRLYAERINAGIKKREVWVNPCDIETFKALFPEWPIIKISDALLKE